MQRFQPLVTAETPIEDIGSIIFDHGTYCIDNRDPEEWVAERWNKGAAARREAVAVIEENLREARQFAASQARWTQTGEGGSPSTKREGINRIALNGDLLIVAELLASVFPSLPHQLERQEHRGETDFAVGLPKMPGWDGDDVVEAWVYTAAAEQWVEEFELYGIRNECSMSDGYLVPGLSTKQRADHAITYEMPARGWSFECHAHCDGTGEFRCIFADGSLFDAGTLLQAIGSAQEQIGVAIEVGPLG